MSLMRTYFLRHSANDDRDEVECIQQCDLLPPDKRDTFGREAENMHATSFVRVAQNSGVVVQSAPKDALFQANGDFVTPAFQAVNYQFVCLALSVDDSEHQGIAVYFSSRSRLIIFHKLFCIDTEVTANSGKHQRTTNPPGKHHTNASEQPKTPSPTSGNDRMITASIRFSNTAVQENAVQQPVQQRRRTSAKNRTRNEQKRAISSTGRTRANTNE
jgi:hypothetical protein